MSETSLENFKGNNIDLKKYNIVCSSFDHCRDRNPKIKSGPVVSIFRDHIVRENKDGPAISPALFGGAGTRANKNVANMSDFILIDCDQLERSQFQAMLRELEGIAYVIHTTHSHAGLDQKIKIRVILILSRNPSVDEYPEVKNRIDAILGGYDDESCSDLARMYYLPAVAKQNWEKREFYKNDGATINVDAILNLPPHLFPNKTRKKNEKGRNSKLTSIAGKLRSKGAGFEDIFAKLKSENNKLFSDNPLDEQEVESIARSVSQYEAGEKNTNASNREGSTNLEIAHNLIDRFKIININDRIYSYQGLRYQELTKGELSSLILRTLDSAGAAPGLEKRDFDEISFFVRGLSVKDKKIVCGKPLDNFHDSADYINLQNGILRINRENWALELLPHSDSYFLLEILPYSYDPEATAETWINFLNKVLPNPAIQALLGEWMGLNLIFDASFARFMMFIGEGANGKSVVILILTLLLGPDAFCSVGLDSMTPDNRFGLAPLIGVKANIVGDMNMTVKFAEGLFKEMVGGGTFTADRKHQPATKVIATARHTFAMNDFPLFRDRSEGIFRRAIAIHFAVTIAKHEQDRRLITEKFWRGSRELPGIFNWALMHLKNLIERGDFLIPSECEKVVSDLKESLQPEVEFMNDVVVKESTSLIPVGELYFRYKSWASENGYNQMSQATFGKELQRRFKIMKTPHAIKCSHENSFKVRDRHWIGLAWKNNLFDTEI